MSDDDDSDNDDDSDSDGQSVCKQNFSQSYPFPSSFVILHHSSSFVIPTISQFSRNRPCSFVLSTNGESKGTIRAPSLLILSDGHIVTVSGGDVVGEGVGSGVTRVVDIDH